MITNEAMLLKCMIIDDELNARDNLRLLLEEYCQGIEIAWEAESAESALKQLSNVKPHLLFLDIEMSGLSGIEFASIIAEKKIPIVFVTAYDNYAIGALKAGAIDYLLKPFTISDLQTAIQKVKDKYSKQAENSISFDKWVNLFQNQEAKPSKLSLPWEGGFRVFEVDQIVHIESDNSYSTIQMLDKRKYVVSKSIGQLEALLKDQSFLRIHNSHLINLNFLSSFSNHNGGSVTMHTEQELPVARRRIAELKKNFTTDSFE